ncbi:MAG: hypothetical protein ABUR63_01340 [Verrucomicrobiota bacterium]
MSPTALDHVTSTMESRAVESRVAAHIARDTSAEASALQTSIHRRLTGSERLRQAVEMSLLARELSAARLRREHPDWSAADLTRELLRYAFLTTRGPTLLPPPLR